MSDSRFLLLIGIIYLTHDMRTSVRAIVGALFILAAVALEVLK